MVKRIFDRRGRQNWDPEKHEAEDRRMRERRNKSDRRVHQRRQDSPWPDGAAGIEQRLAERRVFDRRAEAEAVKENDNEIDQSFATFEADLLALQTTPSLVVHAALLEAIFMLSTQNTGWIMISRDGQNACGILTERNVIEAIAVEGPEALSEPVSRFMTPLTS